LDPALTAERALRKPLAKRLELFRRFLEGILKNRRALRLCEAGV